MAKHPFSRVEYRGELVEIDCEIVPLLEEIWKAEIQTIWSCQEDDDGFVAVGIADVFGAQDFIGIVQDYAPFAVNLRIIKGLNCVGRDPGADAWRFSIYSTFPRRSPAVEAFDAALFGGPPPGFRYSHFVFTARFPRSDLEAVLAALREANATRQPMMAAALGDSLSAARPAGKNGAEHA